MILVLDSAPLGLLTQRVGVPAADGCRAWLAGHADLGNRVIVPEIVEYELRRELLRADKTRSLTRLDRLIADPQISHLLLNTAALRLAAELWAQLRKAGVPTADPHALDIDVILAA
jgi:predicted nucleic acid-binding protein